MRARGCRADDAAPPDAVPRAQLYIAKHLKLVNVELEETVLTELLNKPALASITYARMLVEMLCSFDLDTLDVVKHVDRFPVDADAMLAIVSANSR